MTRLNMRRMRAIARRHALVFKRSPHRWFDVAAPAIDSILFGSLAVVLAKSSGHRASYSTGQHSDGSRL
jgi:ABC-2 type transport system permease protein